MDETVRRKVIRVSWSEWLSSRSAKRAALESRGLSSPSRRSTARPEARAAAYKIFQKSPCAPYALFGIVQMLA